VEPPLHSNRNHWPLQLESLQEPSQGIHDVVGALGGLPGCVVCVDEILVAWTSVLMTQSCPFQATSYCTLLRSFCCGEGQHGQGAAANFCQGDLAHPRSLLYGISLLSSLVIHLRDLFERRDPWGE
jgi:hypothetical protein